MKVSQRPTAALFRDHYAGHYNWFTGEHSEPFWTEWDFALLSAYQLIEDYQDQDGEFPWVSQDQQLRWKPVKIFSGKREAIERAQEAASKNNKTAFGDTITAEVDWEHSDSQVKKKPSQWFAEKLAEHQASMNYPRPDAE